MNERPINGLPEYGEGSLMEAKSGHIIDLLIRAAISPTLVGRGFKRRSRVWQREVSGFSHAIYIQAGRWNSGVAGDFTVSLGIYVPTVYSAIWGAPPPPWARDVEWTIRRGIGQMMPGGILSDDASNKKWKDYWWKFDAGSDLSQLGSQVAETMVRYGLPFLEQFGSLVEVHDFLRDHLRGELSEPFARLCLAVLKAKLGDEVGSREMFEYIRVQFPDWRDWVQRTILHLG